MDKVYAAEGRFCCSSNDEKNIGNSWFWHVTMASSSEPGCQAPTVTVTQGPSVPFFVFRALPALFLADIRRAGLQTTSMHYRLSPNVIPVVHCLMYAILPTYVRPPSSFSDDR